MWIDGIYMGQPFLVNYGRLFDDAAFGNDMAVFQSTLAASHCLDAKTGLLYHAWDQDRNASWADPKTGQSPIIWGRGMGWFVMAMVDILEQLPPSHAGYPRLLELLKKNVAGLAAAQNPKSGLWFQVLDRGASLPGNWIETSSSGMFIYAIRKGIRLGLVDAKYGPVADRAWKGLQATFEQDAAGRPVFTEAVKGMGVQNDAAGYLAVPRLKNSTHGLMAYDRRERDGAGAPDAAAFRDWSAETLPAGVGRRVAENFAARPFERPAGFVIYPEVCAWYGSLTVANLTRHAELRDGLVWSSIRCSRRKGRSTSLCRPTSTSGCSAPCRSRSTSRRRTSGSSTSAAALPTGSGRPDARRHHGGGPLLDRRHVHDHRRPGPGLPRHRRSEVPRPNRKGDGGVPRQAAAAERPLLPRARLAVLLEPRQRVDGRRLGGVAPVAAGQPSRIARGSSQDTGP